MKPITSPLKMGQTGNDVANYQEVLMLLYNAGFIPYDDPQIVNYLANEYRDKFFGSYTAALTQQFKQAQGIPDVPGGWLADEQTIAFMNNIYHSLNPNDLHIAGHVSHESGMALTEAYVVEAYYITYEGAVPLGAVAIGSDGYYSIDLNAESKGIDQDSTNTIDVLVKLAAYADNIYAPDAGNVLSKASVKETGSNINIDVVLKGNAAPVLSEFEDIHAGLFAVTGSDQGISAINIADENTLAVLANQINEPSQYIQKLVQAFRIHDQVAGIAASTAYGLLRQNFPADLPSLSTQPVDVIRHALEVSVLNHIIPLITDADLAVIASTFTQLILAVITNTGEADITRDTAFSRVIEDVLGNKPQTQQFLSIYYGYNTANTALDFWDYLSTQDSSFNGVKDRLRTAIALAVITGNNPALVRTLRASIDGQAADLAFILSSYTLIEFYAAIQNAKSTAHNGDFIYPVDVTGENDQQKTEYYAQLVADRIKSAYPSHATEQAIANDPATPFVALKNTLGNFLSRNPAFDLRTVPVAKLAADTADAQFDFSGIENRAAFIEEAAIVQRLSGVTDSYPLMAAMAQDGVHSSMQIAQQSQDAFVATYTAAAGSAVAAQSTYSLATTNSVYNFMATMKMYTQLNGKQVYVLDSTLFDPQHAYADWRSLFGSLDTCNCSQCQSVYSPSAYLTDLLQFLKNNLTDLYNDLNVRRPDIKNIELTCKNTNTPVPHIDIVNELLEDLASAVINNNGYKLYARQTNNDAATQRAIPEYVNTSAAPGVEVKEWTGSVTTAHVPTPYDALKSAVYPWTLPYNLYKRQIDTHLDIAGVKGFEMLQRFSAETELQGWDDINICTEYLGITKQEKNIIVTDYYTNYALLAANYGLYKNGSWVTTLPDPALKGVSIPVSPAGWSSLFGAAVPPVLTNRVDVFLQQTGLNYTELLQLLDCYTINPQVSATARKMAIVKNDNPKATDDTCDLSMLRISGMTLDVLARLYRFVRLKRVLGWTYYELDKALVSIRVVDPAASAATGPANYNLIPISPAIFKALAQMKKLTSQLGMTAADVLSFGKDIDALPYRNYERSEPQDIPSEYAQLFRNPQLAKIDSAGYPFPADPTLLLVNLYNVGAYLSGILNISGAELDLLLTDLGVPNAAIGYSQFYTEVSKLVRVIKLMKALNLSASEWIAYKKWITGANFNNGGGSTPYDTSADAFVRPLESIRFISFVTQSRSTGLSIAQVEYLLQDAVQDSIAETRLNADQAKTLTNLRTELQKKALPAYNYATDTDGKILEDILQKMMDKDAPAKLVSIIQNPVTVPANDSADDQQFVSANAFFMTAQEQLNLSVLTGNGSYWASAQDRRQHVFEALQRYQETTILQPFVINFLSKEIKLGEDIVKSLLMDCIQVSGTPAITVFLQQSFLGNTTDIIRWTNNANAFRALILLQKAALLVAAFKLGKEDVASIWKDHVFSGVFGLTQLPLKSTQSSLPAVTVYFYNWLTLIRWMAIRSFVDKDMSVLYDTLRQMPATASAVAAKIAPAFKTGLADMNELVGATGVLSAAYPVDFQKPDIYERIIDCLEMQHLLPSSMPALRSVTTSIDQPDSQQAANNLIQIVKAQYDDTQWLSVVRPVNDLLRTERRDALVAFLLANPPSGYANKWFTSNDIFETLMLDVDMMSCMATTRVLLAINTIQLWVDRVLLNLEGNLQLTKDKARQWHTWRKLYRVWEANRKVFIYPENWIEPELRDGKSPFFLELEKFLKQNELTDDNVEEAYQTYLERLDEVAHLEIVGVHREENTAIQTSYQDFKYASNVVDRDTIHVFGRTKAQPHVHYYRKRVAEEWTPWEKMDVQIESDHFMPVMWRGRLRCYWLIFAKDQGGDATTNLMPKADYITPASTRWKINLGWSEYKNGKWSPKQISKDALYSFAIEEESLTSIEQLNYYDQHQNDRCWYPNGTLERQKKERMTFFCFEESDGELRFQLKEKVVRNSTPRLHNQLINGGNGFPKITTNAQVRNAILLTDSKDAYNDIFGHNPGCFKIRYNGVMAIEGGSIPFNNHLYALDMDSSWGLDYQQYDLRNSRYRYSPDASAGYSHYPDGNVKLLNYAPDVKSGKKDDKYIVIPRKMPKGYADTTMIRMPYFFYADYDNSFFVERITVREELAINIFQSSTVKIGKTGVVSTGNLPFVPSTSGGPVLVAVSATPMLNYVDVPKYRFHQFNHATVDDFQEKLHAEGLDGLLNRKFITQLRATDTVTFESVYKPTAAVDAGDQKKHYPNSKVDFTAEHAYSLYNWELFYHIPMLIANKLCNDQKFEEARKWYHYVFNPTAGGDPMYDWLGNYTGINTTVNDFWNFTEFYDNATNVPSPQDLMSDPGLADAVARWADNPFKPHLVARTRISAYMKNTVMKYLDNLIAWGDSLYRTDTRENINEATLLYVLAAQLLGKQPNNIPARAQPKVQTYASLSAAGTLNAFSNAMVGIENYMLSSGATTIAGSPLTSSKSMLYFCILPNDKLAGYWNTVGDRLFKIRHCQNIDGVERELALFDPPIDPALLVKAAAAGLSLSDAIAGTTAPLPNYRFNVMAQKATELTGEVKSLGSQLLSALEKKDAEVLALLRNGQEASLLDAITEIKEKSVEEAVAQINALGQQQQMATIRRDFYQSAINGGLNTNEQLQLDSLKVGLGLQITEAATTALAAALHMIPDITLGVFSFGAQYGGRNIGNASAKGADVLGIAAGINNAIGSMASAKGSWARRKDDWDLQLKVTNTELKQIDLQILSAQIRKAMAEVELKNHKLQLQHNAEMDTAMREKYTNEELYDWMIGQISFTYFQAYKLALDMAKRAERCYQYELSNTDTFIESGYWDSLRKGLLAGEQLSYDIKRMEVAYLDKNKRQLELTKHISLASLNPQKLIELKAKKACEIDIPEWLFDMDYPGQHMRRIKSVSLSIPCVAGPYTTVSCKLSLLKSKYRKSGTRESTFQNYREKDTGETRFNYQYSSIQSIATSHAQNDSGMFEFSFRDERYLPFEGAGAISTWRIELPAAYAQFDYDSIGDVILHVNYTALDEGGLRTVAAENVHDLAKNIAKDTDGFYHVFDLKHEFATEWNAMMNGASHQLVLQQLKDRLPYMARMSNVALSANSPVTLIVERNATIAANDLHFDVNGNVDVVTSPSPVDSLAKNWWSYHPTYAFDLSNTWNFSMRKDNDPVTDSDIRNMYLVIRYTHQS